MDLTAARENFRTYSRKATVLMKRDGLIALSGRVVKKALSPVADFGRVDFFMRDLEKEPIPPHDASGIVLRSVSTPEVHDFIQPDGFAARDAIDARLGRGDRCVVALDEDGRTLHTRWVTTRYAEIPELGLDFVPGPREGYFYDGYTAPEARGRGIDGLVRGFIFAMLRDEGCARAYSYVRGDNAIGLKAARKWQRCVTRVRYAGASESRRLTFGWRSGPLATHFRRSDTARAEEDVDRDRAWRSWFEGFVKQPLAQRSTGYHALPEEYFESASGFVVEALDLDPQRDVVLDLGCDSAVLTCRVAPHCRRLVGADFIPGQLVDSTRMGVHCSNGLPAEFLAADGRFLPLASGTFNKAYCTGMIHTLPSHDDAMQVIRELIRVCRGGGTILLGALPATSKRRVAVKNVWKNSDAKTRARIVAARVVPERARQWLRRRLRSRRDEIISLVFDLETLRSTLQEQGLRCRIADFPPDYWNDDFRDTRSNLLISIPSDRGSAAGSPRLS